MQARLEHILPRLLWWAVLQLTIMEMQQYDVKHIHWSAESIHAKLTSSSRADCAAGTCAGGLCEVDDPSTHSLDNKCSSGDGNKQYGGKWDDCFGRSTNTCGIGSIFCGAGNYLLKRHHRLSTIPATPQTDFAAQIMRIGFAMWLLGFAAQAHGNCADIVIAPMPRAGDGSGSTPHVLSPDDIVASYELCESSQVRITHKLSYVQKVATLAPFYGNCLDSRGQLAVLPNTRPRKSSVNT
ncbi:hypothetical protein T440DRAFT_544023 [Plenodomus tracheiphilus IPT5]|uniref:Glycoside hydrolase family 19 protein n=1 Tax=Plenodomus tracheiphilus IPT5 TaxID=1408161 RepID=A0A6A7ATX3_9PLEO|nr:hypothetical protein T440DRAFT_544023 [Plenodomus tracheiphilus IPT5]